MRKKLIVPLCVMVVLVMLGAACHRDPVEPDPQPDPSPGATEGIYLGVIGFNDQLYVKDISLLNSSTYQNFTNFIDNLTPGNGTALFYADYTALKKMKDYPKPTKLKNVALVTFTDGLDNISTASSTYDPEGYGSTTAYRNALHNKIMNEQIHGLNVSAYSIGLKGGDVTDEVQFMETLSKLASSDNNVFQVSNMDEAMLRFSEIASSLYSISTSVNLGVNVPGGYDDGQHLRFTFDNVTSATSSTRYIEAIYRRTSSSGRTLDNITYYGFAQGPTAIASSSSQGAYYQFLFESLTYLDGNPVAQSDLNNIKLWKQTSTGAWDKETEFNPASSTTVTEEKNSALIVLVLDCTTSLGSDFSNMQSSAKQFVRTLANVSGGGDDPDGDLTGTIVHNAVTDYDGNNYDAVWIGNQLWMAENLRTKHYANGAAIPAGGSNSSNTSPYYYDYSSSGIALSSRGYLYNWPAAMHGAASSSTNPSGVQGICPAGWHLPSDAEWTQLVNSVGNHSEYLCGNSSGNIAKALASTTGWNSSSQTCAVGNNQSSNNFTGFSAVPAGYCDGSSFGGAGNSAIFWSSTEYSSNYAYYRYLSYSIASVDRSSYYKSHGRSVRCLRD